MRSITLSFVIVIAGVLSAVAQDSGLTESEERRLSFYSDKILAELHALVSAQQAGSQSAYEQHRAELTKVTERYVMATDKSGLDQEASEKFFREYFASNFEGRIPAQFANDIGLVTIESLMAGLEQSATPATDLTNDDYVNSIRAVGTLEFGND